MSEGHATPDRLLAMLPKECECGGQDYQYVVGKTVHIAVDEDQPYISGAGEGVGDVSCTSCDRVLVKIQEIDHDEQLLNQMIEA